MKIALDRCAKITWCVFCSLVASPVMMIRIGAIGSRWELTGESSSCCQGCCRRWSRRVSVTLSCGAPQAWVVFSTPIAVTSRYPGRHEALSRAIRRKCASASGQGKVCVCACACTCHQDGVDETNYAEPKNRNSAGRTDMMLWLARSELLVHEQFC